ncbi:MAG TPA: NfeD family protein [Phycisphaerae bacterium]|nr:NfeD family protein [Phycisphaerae bacterium]
MRMVGSGWMRWVGAAVGAAAFALIGLGQGLGGGAGAGPGGVVQPVQPVHEKAALITVEETIDQVTFTSIERRVDEARKAGCTLVVYEIDATGGMMESALKISAFTKQLAKENLPAVAWVRGNASGAPTVVALSCAQIVTSDSAAIGAVGMFAAPEAGKGALPAVLADVEDSAKVNGYPAAVVRAMAIPSAPLLEVKNDTTGEMRYEDDAGTQALTDVKAAGPGGAAVRPWHVTGEAKKKGESLVLVGAEAVKMGVSKAEVNSAADLRAVMNVRGDVMTLEMDFWEKTARFLALPWVRFFLLVGALTFGWAELSHPGISIPGVLAVVCLALLLGGPYMTGLATTWEIIAIVVGLVIVLADLFVVGSLGMLAVPGFIVMGVGLVASFIPTGVGGGLQFGDGLRALRNGLMVVIGGTGVSLVCFALLAKYLRMVPAFRQLQLAPAGGAGAAGGAVTSGAAAVRDVADRAVSDAVFVGALGVAHTQLRPAGKARFGEFLVDVVSFGSFIPVGTEIEVIGISGTRVTVRPRRVVEAEETA